MIWIRIAIAALVGLRRALAEVGPYALSHASSFKNKILLVKCGFL